MGCTSSAPAASGTPIPNPHPTASRDATNQDVVEKTLEKIGQHLPSAAIARQNIAGAFRSVMGANQEALGAAIASAGNGPIPISVAETVKAQNMPSVGIFPADAPLGIATLKALTRDKLRGACAKITCIVSDETKIAPIRNALGGTTTDSIAFAFADFDDSQAMSAAFVGLDRLFLSAEGSSNRSRRTRDAVDCASHAGIGHLVFLSTMNAHREAHVLATQFHEIEIKIKALCPPVPFTFMRSALQLETILLKSNSIKQGILPNEMSDGSLLCIARDDMAKCIAAVLSTSTLHTEHHNKVYELCNPQPITMAEVAEMASEVSGRSVTLTTISAAETKDMLLSAGFPDWYAEAARLEEVKDRTIPVASADITRFLSQGEITTHLRFFLANRYRFVDSPNDAPLVCVCPVDGVIGDAALKALLLRETHCPINVRAIVTSQAIKDKLASQFAGIAHLQVNVVEFANVQSVRTALEKVDRLLVIPREDEISPATFDTVLAEAKSTKVGHVCLVSMHEALQQNPIGARYVAWEKVVLSAGWAFSIIRVGPKMDMIFQFVEDVKTEDHKVHHGYNSGYFYPVDPRDVGTAGAAVVAEGPLRYGNQIFSLQGPQPGSFANMCGELSNVLGFHIEAVPDLDTFQKQKNRLQNRVPDSILEDIVFLEQHIAKMSDQEPNADLFQLIGARTTLKQFLTKNKSKFAS